MRNSLTDAYSYCDSTGDGYTYFDAETEAYAEISAYTKASPNAGASALRLLMEIIDS